ncbi:MAG: 37S ribosomal protein, mitochondrial [Thelocarpon superellum]|nr:MAG: 37S ribosomal protein, mitochondrial [Thelocarpon superellum]
MIVRQWALRHGRRAMCAPQRHDWHRAIGTEIHRVERRLENSLQETHSIEATINRELPTEVTPVDLDLAADGIDGTSIADAHDAALKHKENTHHLGSVLSRHYQPHTLISRPPSPKDITLELLLASQAHLGHSTSLWNPANQRYIFGVRQGIHIISLDVTAAHLRRAAKIVSAVCERAGLVLFVGTRAGQDRAVVNAAELAGGYHLFERWTPGGITNGQQILGHGKLKVVDHLGRDLPGYDDQLVDYPALKPDLVVCLNPLENYVLLRECGQNNIPTIGIIDTDADPTWVTYPIPANDDSLRSVQVIAGILGKAGQEGQQKRRRAAEEGRIPYQPDPRLRRRGQEG